MSFCARPILFRAVIASLFILMGAVTDGLTAYSSPSLKPHDPVVTGSSNSPTTSPVPQSATTSTVTSRSLWIGEKKDLKAADLETGSSLLQVPVEHLEDLAVDNHRKMVWAGGKKYIIQYDFAGRELRRYTFNVQAGGSPDHEQSSTGRSNDADRTRTDDADDHEKEHQDKYGLDHVHVSLDPRDGALWVGAGRQIVKLSPDLTELLRISVQGHIRDIVVDISDRSCWVAAGDALLHYAADGALLQTIQLPKERRIRALATEPSTHSVWVGTHKEIIKYDATGAELFRINDRFPLRDIRTNITTKDLWVITNKAVHTYDAGGGHKFTLTLCPEQEHDRDHPEESHGSHSNEHGSAGSDCEKHEHEEKGDGPCTGNLTALAVDSIDGTGWVASRKTVWKLGPIGTVLLERGGFKQIQALDIGIPGIAITITEPRNGATITDAATTISGTVTDPAATVLVNSREASLIGLAFEARNIPLLPGNNSIIAVASNPAGLSAQDSITVTTPVLKGPEMLVCGELFLEQTPQPPKPGCSSQAYNRSVGVLVGTVDTTTVSVDLNGYLLPDGVEVSNQLFRGKREGTFIWAFVMIPQVDGSYPFLVTATNAEGGKSTAIVTFIRDSVPPKLTFTSPLPSTITSASTITLVGTVDDPYATLRVGWMSLPNVNGTFTAVLGIPKEGLNLLNVYAQDTAGNSSSRNIPVFRDTTPPRITVGDPWEGARFNKPAINVMGSLTEQNPDTITVSVNSGPSQTLSMTGTVFKGSVSLEQGLNTLTFTAQDKVGFIGTAVRTVLLDQDPPIAAFNAPAPNSSLNGTVSVSITASDALAGVQLVTLLMDGSVLAYDTQPPYVFTIDSMAFPSGQRTITARVQDWVGNQTEISMPVVIESQMALQITEPAAGSTVNRTQALVKGTITSNSDQEIGVVVNGILAQVNGRSFAAIVPLQTGANTITAIATTSTGLTSQASITIQTNSPDEPIRLIVNPSSGIIKTMPDGTASFPTTMEAAAYLPNPVASYSWNKGDGSAIITGPATTTIKALYGNPGLYFPTVTVTDTLGNTYTETGIVNVIDRVKLDAILQAKWQGMKDALIRGDIEGAVGFFAESSKEVYRHQFSVLSAHLNEIVADMGQLNIIKMIADNVAECDFRVTKNGTLYSFQVILVRNQSGTWEIQRF